MSRPRSDVAAPPANRYVRSFHRPTMTVVGIVTKIDLIEYLAKKSVEVPVTKPKTATKKATKSRAKANGKANGVRERRA